MSKIIELHDLAMDLAEYALFARTRGDMRVATELTQRAYAYEKEAADLLSNQIEDEPSRSVLYRSAASLAIECGEFSEAERLIREGLRGKPPRDIAKELQELLEQIKHPSTK